MEGHGVRARLSGLLITGLLAGCDETESRNVAITTHALADDCAVPAEATDAELSLLPLGDYPSVEPVLVGLAGEMAGFLAIPEGTRALEAKVRVGEERFIGYSERGGDAEVPILLWPESRACRLAAGVSGYPAPGGGQGLGYDGASRRVLLAGGDDPSQMNKSFEMLGFDTGTGAMLAGLSLEEPREFATITAFAGRLLVAGGEDPLLSRESVVVSSSTAEVVEPSAAAPVVGRVELRVPRTRHAATVLPNGDTLLVGGRGPFGDALNLLEAVSPDGERADVAAFPALQAPRFFPTVLALDDGRLFIAGGTAADESPLSALEWLSFDARERLGVEVPEELPARHDRAFAAMPGGGALVVGGCAPRAPLPDEDCSMCRSGCPPRFGSPADEYDAWWLLPDDSLRPLEFSVQAPRPVLLGDSGRALLSPGAADPTLYRFDPWQARFVRDAAVARCPPRAGLPALGFETDAFVWVSDAGACASEPALFGMRLGARSRYSNELDLVPDRPPVGAAGKSAGYADRELWFATGSDVRVYVAGQDYADFELSFEVGADSAVPGLVFMSQERVGPRVLSLPRPSSGRLQAERSGTELRVGSDVFTVPSGRVHVGFVAGDGETRLTDIRLERIR